MAMVVLSLDQKTMDSNSVLNEIRETIPDLSVNYAKATGGEDIFVIINWQFKERSESDCW